MLWLRVKRALVLVVSRGHGQVLAGELHALGRV